MAITMNTEKVDNSKREQLLHTTVSSSFTDNAVEPNKSGILFWRSTTGASLAGITPEFVSAFHDATTTYKGDIETILSELEAVDSESAFKGASLKAALAKFITSVKQVSFDYLNALKEAEDLIAESVEKVYASQDETLSSDLGSDADRLSDTF